MIHSHKKFIDARLHEIYPIDVQFISHLGLFFYFIKSK